MFAPMFLVAPAGHKPLLPGLMSVKRYAAQLRIPPEPKIQTGHASEGLIAKIMSAGMSHL